MSFSPVQQIYVSLLKHGDVAEHRDHMNRHPNQYSIGIIDPIYQMDGFTIVLEPFDD